MLTRFDSMEKPKFQRAYDDYLNDLKIIAETGRAQDNRELFNDLLEMNSEEEFVYSQTKGHIRRLRPADAAPIPLKCPRTDF